MGNSIGWKSTRDIHHFCNHLFENIRHRIVRPHTPHTLRSIHGHCQLYSPITFFSGILQYVTPARLLWQPFPIHLRSTSQNIHQQCRTTFIAKAVCLPSQGQLWMGNKHWPLILKNEQLKKEYCKSSEPNCESFLHVRCHCKQYYPVSIVKLIMDIVYWPYFGLN